jgi:hypothetical protein
MQLELLQKIILELLELQLDQKKETDYQNLEWE